MKNKKTAHIFLICLACLLLCSVLSLCLGSVFIAPWELSCDLFTPGLSASERIILYIRLPRLLASVLAGSALALSGTILQAVLSNPLAAPNIIGVNAGAGLFTVLSLALFPTLSALLPVSAFIGALLTALIVFAVASRTGASTVTIVLAGVALSSLLNAVTDTVVILFPDSLIGITSFKAGGIEGITLTSLLPAVIPIILGIVITWALSHDLDVLMLGDETAKSLGMDTAKTKLIFLALAALLAGSAVSFSGLIGFIGLIVPHIARRIVETHENGKVIPASIIIGAIFTILCDIISRIIASPFELPLGIVISFIGVPFFIFLLLGRKGRYTDA